MSDFSWLFDLRDESLSFSEESLCPSPNPHLIMRCSFFLGNHNGIGPEERDYIAESIIDFLKTTREIPTERKSDLRLKQVSVSQKHS